MKKLFLTFAFAFLFLPSLAAPASALSVPKPDFLPGPSESVTGEETQNYVFNTTVPRVLNVIIGLLGLASFAGIMIGGFNMLTAYGNEDKVTRARTNMIYSILGFTIILLAYAIVSILSSVSLPDGGDGTFWAPNAYAVDAESDLEILFPKEEDLIGNEGTTLPDVNLPSGDLVTEMLPGIVTNFLYIIGFLIFIALMYGGALMVIGRGNEDMITKAKQIVLYSVIALAMITGAYGIIYGIANLNLNEDPLSPLDDITIDNTIEE